MALKKNITTQHGIDVSNAYHRVEALTIKEKTSMRFHVRAYASVDKPFVEEIVFDAPYNLGGDNPIKQAYEHIKTLDAFSDAEDV